MLKKSFLVLSSVILGLAFFVPQSASAAMNRNAQKEYDYELIDQQPRGIITMQPGEIKTVWIEVKNTGTKMWRAWNADPSAPVRLGTGSKYDTQNRGYNYGSSFYADPASDGHFDIDSWSSNNRIYTMTDGVRSTWYIQPGWHTRFQFKIQAPTTPGTYKEYFTPVVDGVEWMKDIGIYWEITVAGNAHYSYDGSLVNNSLENAKQGDIVTVKLGNPGDGGYVFGEPEFPAGRVRLIEHKHFEPTSGLMGDFGSDQWKFEVLDGNISNYIQIRASQPWVGGNSATMFLLNINPIAPCLSGEASCLL